MVKCYYDLHIHSALSPCADSLMTLNNIVNMSLIKQLDIIAITDHNCDKNIEVLLKIAQNKILVIPGIEVESYEGIHILCLFKDFPSLNQFSKIVYNSLPNLKNNEAIFGKQKIFDENDEVIDIEEKLLLNSSKYKINQLIAFVHQYDGLVFAAHIDKQINSIITVLGFIPDNIFLDGIEVSYNAILDNFKHVFNKYKIIQNSDAHYISDIAEKLNYLELEDLSIEAFFKYFRS